MRYGYDLKNPMDREMYLKMRQREFERVNNKDLTLQEAYTQYLKDNQIERDYFIQREKMEAAAAAEAEKIIEQEIEKKLQPLLESSLNEILKGLQ